jgi:hypothetical protein
MERTSGTWCNLAPRRGGIDSAIKRDETCDGQNFGRGRPRGDWRSSHRVAMSRSVLALIESALFPARAGCGGMAIAPPQPLERPSPLQTNYSVPGTLPISSLASISCGVGGGELSCAGSPPPQPVQSTELMPRANKTNNFFTPRLLLKLHG